MEKLGTSRQSLVAVSICSMLMLPIPALAATWVNVEDPGTVPWKVVFAMYLLFACCLSCGLGGLGVALGPAGEGKVGGVSSLCGSVIGFLLPWGLALPLFILDGDVDVNYSSWAWLLVAVWLVMLLILAAGAYVGFEPMVK